MTVPTASELGYLRSRPHNTKLYLSIYQPEIALQCRLNDGTLHHDKNARTLIYNTVTAGHFSWVESGMVLLVGDTLGGEEKGKVRVRSATATELTIAENSHIDWDNGDYLTVLRFFEITAIYPRMNHPEDLDQTWYKDYDISYYNQNDVLGAFIDMGCHYAGFKNTDVFYTASGTSDMLGGTLSYSWFFEGSTSTGSNQCTPGMKGYENAGHYTTRLIVSGSYGGVDKSYRHVSIYDYPSPGANQGSNIPIMKWEMTDLVGSRDQGGYSTRIKVFENVPRNMVRDNALVVIFAADNYGNTVGGGQSIGGNSTLRSKIVYVGYILSGSITYNYAQSYVEFEVVSPTEIMKKIDGFSVAVNSSSNPATDGPADPDIPSSWALLKDMDVRRGLYHYLKWHSTVMLCTDIQYVGENKEVRNMDTDRSSLYDAAQSWVNGTVMGDIVCDRQGKIWAEVDVSANDAAASYFPITLVMNKMDWIGEPVITERQFPEIAQLELGGLSYSGPGTDISVPYLSQAPGVTPAYKGNIERIEGLVVDDQADINTLSGNVFAFRTSRYPDITFNMSGNYRTLDIAPQEQVHVSLDAIDTVRGITFTNKAFIVRGMGWSYNPKQETFLPSLSVAQITRGLSGDTIIIPPQPPIDDGEIVDPPWKPPIIQPPIIVVPTGSTEHPYTAYMVGWKQIAGIPGDDYNIADYTRIIARTDNFNAAVAADVVWADYWTNRQESNGAVDGIYLGYKPFYDRPERGGYWLSTTGMWKVTGLDSDNPYNVSAYKILDYATVGSIIIGTYLFTYIIDSFCDGYSFRSFDVGPNNSLAVYVACHGTYPIVEGVGFLKSVNDGGTWTFQPLCNVSVNFGGSAGKKIIQFGASGNYLYMMCGYMSTWIINRHVWRWPPVSYTDGITPNPYTAANSVGLQLHLPQSERDDSVVYYTDGNGGQVYNTETDITPTIGGQVYGGGYGYTPSNIGNTVTSRLNSTHVAVTMAKSSVLYTGPYYLMTSTNSGAAWTLKYTFTGAYYAHSPSGLVMHPYDPNKLYICYTPGQSVLYTSDGGATWSDRVGNYASVIGIDPNYPGTFGGDGHAELFPVFR
jgi:hypothetical protein